MVHRILRSLAVALCVGSPSIAFTQTLPPDIAANKTVRIAVNVGYPPL